MFWNKKKALDPRPRPYVEIDGDPFRVELITDQNYAEMLRYCAVVDIKLFRDGQDTPFLLAGSNDDRQLFLSNLKLKENGFDRGTYVACMLYASRRWNVHTIRDGLTWGFRPLLVPLFRDGSFAIDSDMDNNPNGTITSGGTLYINGKPSRWEDGAGLIVDGELVGNRAFDPKTMNVFLGDTVEDYEIKWLHWNGCMFAMHSLIQCHIEDILELTGEPGERIE